MRNAVRELKEMIEQHDTLMTELEHDRDKYADLYWQIRELATKVVASLERGHLGTFLWIADPDSRKPRPVCLEPMQVVRELGIYKNQIQLLGKKGQLFFSEGT